MSLNVVRSRIVSKLSRGGKNCNGFRRLLSSDVPKKEPEVTAAGDAGRNSPWRFLKYGTVVALTGVTAGAGFVTYGKVLVFIYFCGEV